MSPTTTVSVGCFPPHAQAVAEGAPSSASFSDLITKVQSILQGFQLFGFTIDWKAAGAVVIAAALIPGASLLTVLEAVAMHASEIFVHVTPSPVQLRSVFSMLAPAA